MYLRTVPTFVTAHTRYVLRISRYLGVLWVVPTNTGIFLCSFKLRRERRNEQVLLVSKKEKIEVAVRFS